MHSGEGMGGQGDFIGHYKSQDCQRAATVQNKKKTRISRSSVVLIGNQVRQACEYVRESWQTQDEHHHICHHLFVPASELPIHSFSS